MQLAALDEFVREQMHLGQMPGLGLTVIAGNEVVLERGYGFADIGRQEPMTERTPVVIGSTTKALTVAAVMQLAERGLLALDGPIRKHLPDFRLADEAAASQVTIRQALTHSAGLPPTPMDGPAFLYSDDMEDGAALRHLRGLDSAEPVWPPGGGWLYANDGYVLAGRIIEVLSGTPYETYMRDHILGPLGLDASYFAPSTEPEPGVATPYDYGPDGSPYASFYPRSRASNAAGMLISTAHDAGRWLRTVLGHGVLEGRRVLSEESVAEMLRGQVPVPAGPRTSAAGSVRYGLGWMEGTMEGSVMVSHGGSAITMGSHFLLVPQQGLAVAALANSSTDTTSIIAEGVARILMGTSPVRSFPVVKRLDDPNRSLWPRLAGTYRPLEPQNAVTSLLPVEITPYGLRACTYPGDSSRSPGFIHFAPVEGELTFVLYGRGKTGGRASFEIDGTTVRATVGDTPLLKIASRLHSGTVALWRDA